jgi:hypothetical protein
MRSEYSSFALPNNYLEGKEIDAPSATAPAPLAPYRTVRNTNPLWMPGKRLLEKFRMHFNLAGSMPVSNRWSAPGSRWKSLPAADFAPLVNLR